MDKLHLDKLIRISESITNLHSEIVKASPGQRTGYSQLYKSYYELITPIILSNLNYQLEFQVIPKPDTVSFNQIIPSLTAFKSFLDGVRKHEILNSRQYADTIKQEFFIDENKPFTAYKAISDITTSSVTSLKIIDNYLEATSLEFFTGVNTKVNLQILTKDLKPNAPTLKTALAKFLTEWGGSSFEVKTINYFHDRYIIVDNNEVWHLGPSLNRLGIKPAMISKINDSEIAKHILDLFNTQWISARSI